MKILKILSRNIKRNQTRKGDGVTLDFGCFDLSVHYQIIKLPLIFFFLPVIIHHLCTSPYSGRFTIISVLTEYSGSAFQPQQAYETNPQISAEKHFALCAKFSESINLQCMLILKNGLICISKLYSLQQHGCGNCRFC